MKVAGKKGRWHYNGQVETSSEKFGGMDHWNVRLAHAPTMGHGYSALLKTAPDPRSEKALRYGFVIDNRKCIGCHACTLACKSEHQVPLGVNRTHVKYVEKGRFPNNVRKFSVMRCNHCADAPCVDICPTSALYARADGIVDFDNDRCIGCKSCMQACPYDALYIDPETHTAAKCNYCTHRVDNGLEPACVIVCPVEAIVSGDLDDSGSNIARLVANEAVRARKPEKGTRPKLFYVEGDESVLDPSASPRRNDFFWSEQAAGVGHFAAAGSMPMAGANAFQAESEIKGERVYDAPGKGVLWGWEVPAYIWTKAIAVGVCLIAWCYRWLGGALSPAEETRVLILSLVFLGLTGGLLIKDLDRPDRFLYVLLRPHWRSWLVRGAYIITAFGAITAMMLAALLLDRPLPVLAVPGVGLAVLGAVYTAFLLAQAKGRDLWQSPLSPLHMLVHACMAGSIALAALAPGSRVAMHLVLIVAIALNLGLTALEHGTPHSTADAERAARLMRRGPLGRWFLAGLLLGNLLPLLLLLAPLGSGALFAAGSLALMGVFALEYARITAPQRIPLS